MQKKYLVGVDEAGRGPLAGPVAVGVACVPKDFNWKQLPGVNDSKKLTEKKREAILLHAKELQKEGRLQLSVSMVSAKVIDEIGIVPAVQLAMERSLDRLAIDAARVRVKLDGGLRASEIFSDQETIVKGDSKEKVIGLASIAAKVARDHYMQRIAKKAEYAVYDFAQHKGYGTKAHCAALEQNGVSEEHRRSFCGRFL